MTKLRFWDRIWSAVMGIICIALAAALVLYAGGWLPVEQIRSALALSALSGWQRWLFVGVCALLLLLSGFQGIHMLFRRRKDKGFVIQHSEFGDMSISMKAMENMVRRCIAAHDELTVNQTRIYLVRNGVSVDLKITLASGVNIPLTVNALQKQIKQYLTSCSGVDVHEVRVKVETDAVKLLPPPQTTIAEPQTYGQIRGVEPIAENPVQPVQEEAPCAPQHSAGISAQAEESAELCAENAPEVRFAEEADVNPGTAEEAHEQAPAEMTAEDISAAEEEAANA